MIWSSEVKTKISSNYDDYSARISEALRERAITEAKARIALAGRSLRDISPDELEFIVKEEEDKIKTRYKNNLGIGLLAYLGLT